MFGEMVYDYSTFAINHFTKSSTKVNCAEVRVKRNINRLRRHLSAVVYKSELIGAEACVKSSMAFNWLRRSKKLHEQA